MKKYFFIIGSVLIVYLLLSGCTPYKSVSAFGGYSETRIDTNIFRVYFKGNGYTSEERATDFCLLRCAILCKESGYKYFVIINNDIKMRESLYTSPDRYSSNYTISNLGNVSTVNGNTYRYGGNTYVIRKPSISNTILCVNKKENIDEFVYNSDFIIKSLKSKYNITENIEEKKPVKPPSDTNEIDDIYYNSF